MLFLVVVAVVVGVPLAWFMAELRGPRATRVTLGFAMLGCSYLVAWLSTELQRRDVEARYGAETARLLGATSNAIARGDGDTVRHAYADLMPRMITHDPWKHPVDYRHWIGLAVDEIDAAGRRADK